MAQTNDQRKSRIRARRLKRRAKQLMWAGALVAIGATLVHNPFPITSAATSSSNAAGIAASTASTSTGNVATDGQKQAAFLQTALAATNAKATGYAIHDWTVVNQQFLGSQQLAALGTQLEQEFGMSNTKITSRSEQNQSFWQVDGRWPNSTNVRVVLTSLQGAGGSKTIDSVPQTVMTVTALGSTYQQGVFSQQYDTILHLVSSVQGTPQMSAYLTGNLPNEVTESQANNLTATALSAVGAVSVESLKTQYETSVSGYSRGALTYIDSGTRRMNVQVAVHSDTYRHSTDVLVGTPIITTTY